MLPGLTGLRFLLAALVVLFHYTKGRQMPGPEPWLNLVAVGDSAVTGFFVLSGFVLAKTYLLPDGTMKGTSKAFWSARFARIYPIYALSLILVAQAYLTTAPRTVPEVLWAAGTAITLTQSWWPETSLAINSAAWSLSVEAFLYLVFPVLAPAIRSRAGVVLALAAVAAAVVTPWNSYNPLCHLPAFAAGIAWLPPAPTMAMAHWRLDGNHRSRARLGRKLGRALAPPLRRLSDGSSRPRSVARFETNGPSR